MADTDPWAGLVDPRAAFVAARRALAGSSSTAPSFSSDREKVSCLTSTACAQLSQISSFSRPPGALKQISEKKSKQKSDCSYSSHVAKAKAYASPSSAAGLPESDPDRLGDCGPAKCANPLKYGSTSSDCSENALASAAKAFAVTNTVPSPTAHLSGPAGWRDGLAWLDRHVPPCPGFRSGEWEGLHHVIAHFMDHYAAEASVRGWTALDLFGVHRDAGAAAVDACGALMLPWRRTVTSLSADAIAFGPLVYRRRPMPEAVPVWSFQGRAG